MPYALARAAVADLRRHRFQAILIFTILATATVALSLAVMVQRVTAEPFDRLMVETNGAHTWLMAPAGIDLAPVASMDGVVAATGPLALAEVGLARPGGSEFLPGRLTLLAQPASLPEVGRPSITEGRWIGSPAEVVLDPALARFMGLRPGDELLVGDADNPVSLTVVGMAVHLASWGSDGEGLTHRPFAYVLPETVSRLAPDPTTWQSVLGVRLDDPSASQTFASIVLDQFGAGDVVVTDWQDLRDTATADSEMTILLLNVFSVFALIAAGLVIANAVGGRVLAQFREIGLLKAVGFTPAGILVLLLMEHVLIGLAAAAAGLLAGGLLAPLAQDDLPELLSTIRVSPWTPLPLLLVVATVTLVIVIATAAPAVRAARIPPVQAITVGFVRVHRAGSRLAWTLTRLRLPIPIVVGVKDAFARPLRAAATVAALAMTVVTLTFSLGMDATLQDLLERPERWGAPFDLAIRANGLPVSEIEQILAEDPAVQSYVARHELAVRVPGEATDVTAFALAGDVAAYTASVPEGRVFTAPGEAIVGQALLDRLGLGIGDVLALQIDGARLGLRVVGRYIDTEFDGEVALFGFDTYRAAVDGEAQPDEFLVRIAPDVPLFEVMRTLVQESGGQLLAQPVDLGAQEVVVRTRAMLIGLNLILVVIGVVNLLATTMLGVRERFRDVGILRAVGMTPGQVVNSVLAGAGALAILAIAVGVPLGLVTTRIVFDELGERMGVGRDLGTMPAWTGLVALLPVVLGLAIVGGLLPARRASALHITHALRYE